MESKDAEVNVGSVTEALGAELNSLESKTGDWGTWDDSYLFVQGKNDTFAEINFNPIAFEQLQVNAIVYVHNDGNIYFAREYDFKNKELVETNKNWEYIFSREGILQKDVDKSTNGIVCWAKPIMFEANRFKSTAKVQFKVRL
jgi:sensor domain CHASE-containing protein